MKSFWRNLWRILQTPLYCWGIQSSLELDQLDQFVLTNILTELLGGERL